MKTRSMKTIIDSHPLKKSIEKEGLSLCHLSTYEGLFQVKQDITYMSQATIGKISHEMTCILRHND
jgi:hypothetical protein